jgi:hypothetical protein
MMKKILKEWNNYLEEKDDFDSEGNLIEENFDEPLNEIAFGGAGLVLLGKLFVVLFKALQSKDELADLNSTIQQSKMPQEAKEVTAKMVDLLNTVEKNAPAIEKMAAATGAGGNLNPLNWKTNALIALAKKAVQGLAGKEDEKQIFENWRKHLNEAAYEPDPRLTRGLERSMGPSDPEPEPEPLGPEEDLFITMVDKFKEKHPELNIGDVGYTPEGKLYIQFGDEYVTLPDGLDPYEYLRKRAGY